MNWHLLLCAFLASCAIFISKARDINYTEVWTSWDVLLLFDFIMFVFIYFSLCQLKLGLGYRL